MELRHLSLLLVICTAATQACNTQFTCPNDGLHADPCDCQWYYNCHAGTGYHTKCADGTLYDPTIKNCNWEANVECSISGATTSIAGDTTQQPQVTQTPVIQTPDPGTDCGKVIVCYYSNWAYYRHGEGKYTVDDIDLNLCTHLMYAFAVLDETTYKMKAHDSWLDLDSGLGNFKKFTALKQKKSGLKTLLALGGWRDSRDSGQNTKYSVLVASSAKRQAFITHAITFLNTYGFDGLDLDWEYPGYDGNTADKANFATFVQELKTAFQPHGFMLTAAVSAGESTSDAGYDIPKISQYLDLINLMTYDMHGSWDSMADHHAPLYDRDTVSDDFNCDNSVNYWITNGAPASKLVLGVPVYGRSFTLSTGSHMPPASASGAGNVGSITNEAGILSYLEICKNINTGWIIVKDTKNQMGPYAYNNKQWVGYDDIAMARTKAQYARNKGLAGTMIWAVDLADFKDTCNGGRYPLLNAMKSELSTCTPVSPAPVTTIHPGPTGVPTSSPGPVSSNKPVTSIVTTNPPSPCNNVLTCYYSNWAYYRQGSAKYEITDIDVNVCTHLIYAFASLDASTYKIKSHDPWLDLEDGGGLGYYKKFTSLKSQKSGLKTLLAIGGWTDSMGSKYSELVASSSRRSHFITHVIPFLQLYGFDGLDLDWEYPGKSGNAADKGNFALFVQELNAAFKPHGLLLTAAVSASETVAANGYDIPKLSMYLDYIHLMTYDLHASWESMADHHAPLYDRTTVNDNLNSDYTVNYWINNGADRSKLVLGVPIYGRSFTLSTSKVTPPAPAYGGGTAGTITGEIGYLSYLEICQYIKDGWTVVQDFSGKIGSYAYNGNQWVGYDDIEMARKKAQYAKSQNLAGTMVWAIDLGDFDDQCGGGRYPLLTAMMSELVGDCESPGGSKRSTVPTTGLPATTAPPPPGTTAPPNPSCSSTFTCPSNGLFGDPCNCQKYYNCWAGTGYHYTCADGTLWNNALTICDWDYNVNCNIVTKQPSA